MEVISFAIEDGLSRSTALASLFVTLALRTGGETFANGRDAWLLHSLIG